MSYVPAYVNAAGLTIPSYTDIYNYLIGQFQTIYGANVNLDDSDADPEMISVFALLASDVNNSVQLAYNARSPLTAVGADLDSIVKINGIARLQASYSTANFTIGGVAGSVIPAGVVQDTNGNLWALPLGTTIPGSGSIVVTGTCEVTGAVLLTPPLTISTPTAGWNTVTGSQAGEGAPIETDSALRARQSLSVALSSKTLLIGTISAIAAIPGVTRYATGIQAPNGQSTSVENPTGSTDFFSNPAHSITMVVEGGNSLAIATAIYSNKSIGCYTNGTTTVPVTDPVTGNITDINFYRPAYDPVSVLLVVHGLNGFTSATVLAIQAAVFAYLNELQIGEELTISGVYGVALSVMPSLLTPQFSIQAVYAGLTSGASGVGTFVIQAPGTGYVVNDVVALLVGSGCSLKVTSVSGGLVTGLAFIGPPGTGYSIGVVTTSGGTGAGLTVDILSLTSNGTTDIVPDSKAVIQGAALSAVVVQQV